MAQDRVWKQNVPLIFQIEAQIRILNEDFRRAKLQMQTDTPAEFLP